MEKHVAGIRKGVYKTMTSKAIMNPGLPGGKCPACGKRPGTSASLAYVVFIEGKDGEEKYNPNCRHCMKIAGRKHPEVIF